MSTNYVPKFSDADTVVDSSIQDNGSQVIVGNPILSPALTGTPTAPTATAGTNTTQVATTAFVATAVAAEVTARETLEDNFTEEITAESASRSAADTALQANITSEATARANSDATIQNDLVNESVARIAADSNAQDLLEAEASARSSGDALALKIASNLSDLDSAATARTNLGLGTAATTDTTAYATQEQGALADSAVQPAGTPVANQLAYWTAAQILAGANLVSCDATKSRIGIGTLAPLGALHVVGNGLTAHDFPGFVATDDSRAKTLGVQGDTFAYLVGYTPDKSFACGISTVGKAFAGSVTAHDFDLRRENVAKITLTADGATLPAETASRVVCLDASKTLKSSSVTTTELESLTGITGNIKDQLDAEASARLAADLALQASQPSLRAITYTGGFSAFAASAARSGWLDYGGAVMLRVCALGAGTLADMAPLALFLTDSDGSAARVQVSLALGTGTLVMQTSARALPLSAWRRLGVRVDAPSGGALSSASVAVHIEGETYTLANGGLEVVGTAYSGAPAAGTGAWTLCAASDGSNSLRARVASDGWQALNYPLSVDDYALWFATGKLPHAGAGTMQGLSNPSFESFTGTADDGVSDTFTGWTRISGTNSCEEVVTGGTDGLYAVKLTRGTPATGGGLMRGHLPALVSGRRIRVSAWTKGSGTAVGRWALGHNAAAITIINDINGQGNISTGVSGATWTRVVRTFDVPAGTEDVFVLLASWVNEGNVAYWDDVRVSVMGDFCAGLDLAAQPVCARTAGGEVLLHSASGVEVPDLPERMTLATQLPMTASGYLLGDRLTHPAGYVVERVLVTKSGSASATVTLRAGSSGGAAMATGTVAATGLPVSLPIGSLSGLTVAGGKVYVTGAATTSPLTITVILVRA